MGAFDISASLFLPALSTGPVLPLGARENCLNSVSRASTRIYWAATTMATRSTRSDEWQTKEMNEDSTSRLQNSHQAHERNSRRRIAGFSEVIISKKSQRATRKSKIDPASLEGVDEDVVNTAGFLPRPVQGGEKSGWRICAHVSAAGGVEKAPVNAAEIGTEGSTQLKFDPKTDVLVHGNYLVNLGHTLRLAIEELTKARLHSPGSTVSLTTPANPCTSETAGGVGGDVVVVLENTAPLRCCPHRSLAPFGTKGSPFAICNPPANLVRCLQVTASQLVTTSERKMDGMRKFDQVIGLKYLKGMPFNDTKIEFGSKKDHRDSIGMGSLGLASSHHILNDPRTKGIPFVLETPSWERPKEVWGTEIDVLRRLITLPVATGAKANNEGLAMIVRVPAQNEEAHDTLETLRDDVKAAIQRVGGDQPKSKKGKGKLAGDSTPKAKAAKGQEAGLEEEEKEKEEKEEDEDGVKEEGDGEGEDKEGGCCKH
ncbi:xylose isomerase-like protein [Coprinopsis sp. MPI-PUGE-AT-0042]|nr:xylose isomerase-like protein [Coprinopsis sp. MPI-PUGE-AT-0042]